MTKFETALELVQEGKLKTPKVMYGSNELDSIGYMLSVHLYNLKIMNMGMKCKGIKLKDIKTYYGLKGKTTKECLDQFLIIKEKYFERFQTN
jgi:hypothetical protein